MRVRALPLVALPLLAFGADTFRFDTSAEKVLVWGRGAELPRRYFDEFLPALFERTLVFERFEPGDGALEWIFTGERAGFTVRLDRAQVRISQRFYDSFGLGEQPATKRHPERTWLEGSAPYAGPARELRVVLDHRLGLAVFVNRQQALRQTCLFDVRRHQLAFSAGQGRIEGSLAKQEAASAVIRVDPARRHQAMLGFGGITTPMAWRELSAEGKRRWWRNLREYNLLLHREYPMGVRLNAEMTNWDRPEDATPHYYGDNFPNGEVSDFEYLKAVRRIGARVLFEFWELPVWARRDKVADPEPYARAIVRYCQLSRERAGAPPDIVGIQNERSQPPEVWHAMTLRLRQELDRAGFRAVKIHMQDSSSVGGGITSARAFRASDAVWSAIDYSASHMYDYQKFLTDPDGFDALLAEWAQAAAGKPFLSTEISVNQVPYQIVSYRLAFGMGQLYHKNLTIANASALLYCWLLLNVEQPSYGATRSLFVPDPSQGFVPTPSSYQLRVFGAYSRRIREGMTRVEAPSPTPDLLATAFAGDRGERTVVVLNRSLQPQRVSVDWKGAPFRFLEVTDPYRENAVLAAPAGEVLIEPGAVATLSTVPLLAEVQP